MSVAELSQLVSVQKHFNDRKRFEYWLVVATQRMEEPQFRRVHGKCVELGGWYSRRWMDIPAGFGFRQPTVAEQFSEWLAAELTDDIPAPTESVVMNPPFAPVPRVPSRLPVPRPKAVSPAGKFRQLADGMESVIRDKLKPMSQGWTVKRGHEYAVRCHDGHVLQRSQAALRALADAYDRNAVPDVLRGLRTKAEVCSMMRTRADTSGGYLAYRETDEFSDNSDAAIALRALVAGTKSADDIAQESVETQRREIEHAITELRGQRIEGFFPTPKPVVLMMLERAAIRPGNHVLEPSAGIGSIADEVRGSVKLTLCEIRPSLVAILKRKGFANVVDGDFLESFQNGVTFDRILMNPPFERRQDEKHIRRAFELLADGGVLVAIATPNGSSEFESWLEEVGADVELLPANSFNNASAFNRTGVSSRLIVISK